MWIIGHRGAAGTSPENTLLSIKEALNYGVDWVEIDVRIVDDTIIVLHDETLDRTTNGSGSIYQYSIADLRKVDAGCGEKIPLLVEVMQAIDARAGLNIEIKQQHIVQQLISLTNEYLALQPNWRNHLMLSSFIPEVMTELSLVAPDGCLLGALSDSNLVDPIQLAHRFNAYSTNISLGQLSRALVEQAHRHGLKVLVYTVNDAADIRRCFELSVDGIFTDFPERAIAFINNSPIIPGTLK
jgi:glycerophosphoryl diester phosphodiesterase